MARRAGGRRGGRSVPGLKRRKARLEPRRRFILFLEGRKTEPAYFDALKRACRSALIEIDPHPGVGVPYTIAEKAVERARELGLAPRSRRRKDSFEDRDQVWAVFDRDEHPRFNEAVELCRNHGVGVGRSDPCFELWLILHERDYDRPDDRHAVQAELRRLRPEYEIDGPKTPDCEDLIRRVEDAERRGDEQLRRREEEDNAFGNPSTTVGQLTTAIREAARHAP
ncbi:MAG: RloB family protein [Gammaproteobacteria bacterium]|nr:RloB family protein [Gammaproteobacteria bacterium]